MASRSTNFSTLAFEQLQEWMRLNPKNAIKIGELLTECARKPFEGKGKPEPLKGDFKGYWSRRITDEHRLIYKVDNDFVYVYSCKGHYDK